MILKIGVVGKYFILNGKSCQCGQYDYEFTSDGYLLIWDKVGSNKNNATRALLAAVLDGDSANAPFANQAAIEAWLNANFFFIASASGGGSVDWLDVTSKPTEFTPEAHAHNGNDIQSGIVPAVRLGNAVPDGTKVLYGDSVWRTAPGISGLANGTLPVATSATTVGNSVLKQTSSKLHVGGQYSVSGQIPELGLQSAQEYVFAIKSSSAWGTYSYSSVNTTVGSGSLGEHFWTLAQGGSGNTVASAGVGPNGFGLFCSARYGVSPGAGDRRAWQYIFAANGNTYFNPEFTTGDMLSGNFALGYRADAAIPQRLSVSGGGYFSTVLGVGTPTPHASAILDLNSDSKGLGFTQLTTAQILAIPSPKQGLTLFNTDLQKLCVYSSNGWRQLADSAM